MPRIAPDSNDIIVMPLNDGPTSFINKGLSGSSDNWTAYGSPIAKSMGLLQIEAGSVNGFGALYIPGSYIGTGHNGAGGSNNTLITPNVSLSGWVFLRRTTNFFC